MERPRVSPVVVTYRSFFRMVQQLQILKGVARLGPAHLEIPRSEPPALRTAQPGARASGG